jgi:Cof subfamily protein (haloacid dehalogenase superfamily)
VGEGNKATPVVAFFDVDGTLTDRGNDDGYEVMPTARVQEAIHAFVEQGNVAVVCTGRSILGVRGLRDMPFSGFVTLNGTHVILGDQVILNHVIHADMLSRTLEEMRRVGMEALIEGTYGNVLVSGVSSDMEQMRMPRIEDYERAGGRMEFGKIDFMDSSMDAYRASEFLTSCYTYFNVGDGYHELSIPGTSKGIGGRALIDALPFEPSRVYAFGDSENDLGILAEADVAVVMENASDVVKRHADYVTDHVHDDGVVTALEHFGLI